MFSVGATPFNSKARQIYGGWTPAQAAGNLYAMRKAYEMQAKYSTDPTVAAEAKNWMRSYRLMRKRMPDAVKAALNRSRKALGFQRYLPKPLTKAQKDKILALWEAVDINDKTPEGSYKRKLFSSTYPPYGALIQYPELGRPFQELVPEVMNSATTADQIFTTGPSMATNFFATPAERKAFFADPANAIYKPIRIPRGTALVTDDIRPLLTRQGVTPRALQEAINRLAVKNEEDDEIMEE